jgi:hypothetical protein
MKKSLVVFTALSLSLATSACTHNSNPESDTAHKEWQHRGWSEQDHMHMMHMMADAMYDGMDKNHDGTVTKKEYEEYSRKWFRDADANHDGKLTREEFFEKLKRDKKLLAHRVHSEETGDTNETNDDNDRNDTKAQ